MKSDNFYAKIDIETYNGLLESQRLLKEFLNSDKCMSVKIYEHGSTSEQFIVNPPPDFKQLYERIQRGVEDQKAKYWSLNNLYKKISIFDLGKRIYDIVK